MGRFDCDAARAVPLSLEVLLLCAYVAREFKRIVLEDALFSLHPYSFREWAESTPVHPNLK